MPPVAPPPRLGERISHRVDAAAGCLRVQRALAGLASHGVAKGYAAVAIAQQASDSEAPPPAAHPRRQRLGQPEMGDDDAASDGWAAPAASEVLRGEEDVIRSACAIPERKLGAQPIDEIREIALGLPQVASHGAEHHGDQEECGALGIGNGVPALMEALDEYPVRLENAASAPAVRRTAALVGVVHSAKQLRGQWIHEDWCHRGALARSEERRTPRRAPAILRSK